VVWWCNGNGLNWWLKGPRINSKPGTVKPWASCSHTCASVTKQYNLVLVKVRWCSLAGKVTTSQVESTGSLSPGLWPCHLRSDCLEAGISSALHTHRRCAVAQPRVNGDRLSQWRMAKFDPMQIRNPSTDRHKIWNRWLRPRDDPLCKISCKSVHWRLLGKWVKYNQNFSSIYIPFLLTDLQVRPPGGFSRAMARTTRPHARVKLFWEPKFEVNI